MIKVRFSFINLLILSLLIISLNKLWAEEGDIIQWISPSNEDINTTDGVISSFTTECKSVLKYCKTAYLIEYEYEVDGQQYINSRVDFNNDYFSVDQYRANYPVGTKVLVYFIKSKPQYSTLNTRTISHMPFYKSLLIICAYSGLFYIFNMKKKFARKIKVIT
ncbi:DUF3592 domain-containing protein [Dasania sp. GY-19]|uniref:DUF3592 domain-containing protein n=1 Tax=Dasania phycosphaerae TaxID=2950436 RepID=A0A9J6RS75_9GAMM|nr:DUF3592 domain-containing protein [Dasania phycosphaerae]MCZ0867284.1 DUF3592 domain-containing protein [Dasania phycosphaerae]